MKKAFVAATLALAGAAQMAFTAETPWNWMVSGIKMPGAAFTDSVFPQNGTLTAGDGSQYDVSVFYNGVGFADGAEYDTGAISATANRSRVQSLQVNVYYSAHDYPDFDGSGYTEEFYNSNIINYFEGGSEGGAVNRETVLGDVASGALDLSVSHLTASGSYGQLGYGGDIRNINQGAKQWSGWFAAGAQDSQSYVTSATVFDSSDEDFWWFAVVSAQVDGQMYYMVTDSRQTQAFPTKASLDGNSISAFETGSWVTITPVPEPATAAIALAGVALLFRRKRK